MSKRKKRQFHCEKCNSPCDIYKKGKKHRVLICPNCGVLATNPLPLLSQLLGTIKKPKDLLIPPVGRIAKSFLGETETEQTTATAPRGALPTHKAKVGETKGERYVKMALGGI